MPVLQICVPDFSREQQPLRSHPAPPQLLTEGLPLHHSVRIICYLPLLELSVKVKHIHKIKNYTVLCFLCLPNEDCDHLIWTALVGLHY